MGVWKAALLVLATAVVITWLPSLLQKRRPVVVGGFVKPGWEKVEQIFRKQVESGEEPGASFAVYHRGEAVVHLYGGYADEEANVPWRRDTLSCYWSSTKGVGAIVLALLVERGHLDYDEPVVKYWPEFAQKGKDKVTVRQLLSHQAGIVGLDESVSVRRLVDQPEKVAQIAAATTPMWKLGDGFGYHAFTIGIYVDELVRRTDPEHRSVSQFFADEIQKPFGIDFYIGLPRSEHYRTARFRGLNLAETLSRVAFDPEMWVFFKNFLFADKDHPLQRAAHAFKEPELNVNDPSIREIPLPSALGFGTSIGMAKLWGIVANDGEVNGERLMKPETVKTLYTPVISGIDKCIGMNMTWGVATDIRVSLEGNLQAGHPGFGGQMGFMDHKRRLGWGYLTSHQFVQMVTPNYIAYTNAMYDVIKNIK